MDNSSSATEEQDLLTDKDDNSQCWKDGATSLGQSRQHTRTTTGKHWQHVRAFADAPKQIVILLDQHCLA
jgi:hypothetical protein